MQLFDGSMQDADFRRIVDSSSTAILVKDEEGYCLHANRAAGELLNYDPDEIAGMHMTQLGSAEPSLIQQGFERLLREKVWVGRYPALRRDGSIIMVAANGVTRVGDDGCVYAVEFLYPVERRQSPLSPGKVFRSPDDLTTYDRSLLQLLSEGLTDEQVAVVLGIGKVTVEDSIRSVLRKMDVASRTEACIRAFKSHLVY
jgi:PAS domain S-box-containing protein